MRAKSWLKLWTSVFEEPALMVACKKYPYLFQGWVGLLVCALKCGRDGRLETNDGPMTIAMISETVHLDPRKIRRILGWTCAQRWTTSIDTDRGTVYIISEWSEYQETSAAHRMRSMRSRNRALHGYEKVTSIVTGEVEGDTSCTNVHSVSVVPPVVPTVGTTPSVDARAREVKGAENKAIRIKVSKKPPRFHLDMDMFEWVGIDEKEMEYMRKLAPACDIEGELRKAAGWVKGDPSRKKTNWPKFIYGWLGRAQDRGGSRSAGGKVDRMAETRARLKQLEGQDDE
jgi:hypothetical protein